MKRTLRRSTLILIFTIAFIIGIGFFTVELVIEAKDWVDQPYNAHISGNGGLEQAGKILDRNGNRLAETIDGERVYNEDEGVRKALLHTVGDNSLNISTAVQSKYRSNLTGYSLIWGLNMPQSMRTSRDITLTVDSETCKTAYNMLQSGFAAPKRREERGMAGESLLPVGAPDGAARSGMFTEEGYLCRRQAGVGPRAWSLLLTNGRLGWLAADTGCGNLWLDNAREGRLTAWLNDPLALQGTEELCLLRDGRSISLMADADEAPTEILYGFGFIRWRRWIGATEATLTGFIPPRENRRYLLLELREARPTDRLRFRIRPGEPGCLRIAAGEKTLLPAAGELQCLA